MCQHLMMNISILYKAQFWSYKFKVHKAILESSNACDITDIPLN